MSAKANPSGKGVASFFAGVAGTCALCSTRKLAHLALLIPGAASPTTCRGDFQHPCAFLPALLSQDRDGKLTSSLDFIELGSGHSQAEPRPPGHIWQECAFEPREALRCFMLVPMPTLACSDRFHSVNGF